MKAWTWANARADWRDVFAQQLGGDFAACVDGDTREGNEARMESRCDCERAIEEHKGMDAVNEWIKTWASDTAFGTV